MTNACLAKLWVELHFQIWEYWNDCVHGEGGWIEARELPGIDRDIMREFELGRSTMDSDQLLILR